MQNTGMADALTTPAAQATALVRSALEDVDDPTVRLSALIRKAIRIARLRNDYAALLWLDMEMRPLEDTETKQRIANEIAPHFTREEYERVAGQTVKAYIA